MHLIRVFQGGEKAEQAESFIAALNDARNQIIPVDKDLKVEVLTVAMLKKSCWKPKDLIDWLLDSNGYTTV